jgi:hypothetical protein
LLIEKQFGVNSLVVGTASRECKIESELSGMGDGEPTQMGVCVGNKMITSRI